MLIVFHYMLVTGLTIRIMIRDDLSAPARLAWFAVLTAVPFLGVAIYFLFGEVDAGQQVRDRYTAIFAEMRSRLSKPEDTLLGDFEAVNRDYRPGFRYAASVNGFGPLVGNRAELMKDADETRDRIIADIDAAEDHVHVAYYIWLTDQTGTALAQALIRAAKRGVKCRAMADGLGSRVLIRDQLWKDMAEAGVETAVALPISPLLRTIVKSRFDLRNHRKITIIDGRITYCGSRNSADPEFLPKKKYAPWVDIMLRFEGPVVAQNQLLFASDWMAATNQGFEGFPLISEPLEGGFVAQVIGDGPTERLGATPQLFANLLGTARQEITISTPYFVPDSIVLDALISAAHRGIHVRLIFPLRNDSWVVAAASRSFYRRLLEAGCEIYEFRDGLLHAKTLTIDGKVSLIGSTNLDLRSFDLNYENNILLQDARMTAEIMERQESYLARSNKVGLDLVNSWSYPHRIWNNAIATIGPVL